MGFRTKSGKVHYCPKTVRKPSKIAIYGFKPIHCGPIPALGAFGQSVPQTDHVTIRRRCRYPQQATEPGVPNQCIIVPSKTYTGIPQKSPGQVWIDPHLVAVVSQPHAGLEIPPGLLFVLLRYGFPGRLYAGEDHCLPFVALPNFGIREVLKHDAPYLVNVQATSIPASNRSR